MKRRLWIGALALLAMIAGFLLLKKETTQSTVVPEATTPPLQLVNMPDSVIAYYSEGSQLDTISQPGSRTALRVNGDIFLEVPASDSPLLVKTRLLNLTVTGPAAFRVMAYDKDDGEEVDMITGTMIAQKSYASDFPEPDTLYAPQMVMINISIDLMEKEKFDPVKLKAWQDSVHHVFQR